MSSYMSRLFPKSNSSFLLTSGQALQSEVLRLNKEAFLVDTGLGNPKICLKDELTRVPSDPKVTRFNNKVGFLDMVTGEKNISKQILERFFINIMTGDLKAKEIAISKLNELVGPCMDAVPGEPLLLLPTRFRQKVAGLELKKLQKRGGTVNGFVTHKMRGGYAVAVAGFIAFLPGRTAWSYNRSMGAGKFHVNCLDLKT
ncbi:small ribosomal subunit protein bS1m-like [Silene latifolia]|uniref:small ribosomal subunit protein bS1m-like n=1 Tax=Silene latifolia TaxID=37657 RepID=UPI003D76F2D2